MSSIMSAPNNTLDLKRLAEGSQAAGLRTF